MKIEILNNVRHDGKEYVVGDVTEIETTDAQRLIDLGVAVVSSEDIDNVQNDGNANGNDDDQIRDDGQGDIDSEDLTDEEVADILDKFTLKQLEKELATLNVDVPKSLKKPSLIAFIIDNEHEEHFLDLVESAGE